MTETALGYIRLSQNGRSLPRQQRDVEDYADSHGYELLDVYNEGRNSSGYTDDRPEYQALLNRLQEGAVDAVIVPNLSRLSRDRKERLRLLLDLDETGVAVCACELGRAVDLDDDWELVQQAVTATTDDVAKRKEIKRSKRATKERLQNGYDHGRPPFGFTFDDDGQYWVPDDDFDTAREIVRLRDLGRSFSEIVEKTGVPRGTVQRTWERRDRIREHAG